MCVSYGKLAFGARELLVCGPHLKAHSRSVIPPPLSTFARLESSSKVTGEPGRHTRTCREICYASTVVHSSGNHRVLNQTSNSDGNESRREQVLVFAVSLRPDTDRQKGANQITLTTSLMSVWYQMPNELELKAVTVVFQWTRTKSSRN